MRSKLMAVVPLLLVISAAMRESTMKHVLRTVADVVVCLWIVSEGHRGYQRRRLYWTRASWVPFLACAALPFTAFASTLGIAYGIDEHWPLFGRAETPLRLAWVSMMLVLIIGGAALFFWVHHKLLGGDPQEPFTWRRRVRTA